MIIQCPACKALVNIDSAVYDDKSRRAGLKCGMCSATAWLPTDPGSMAVAVAVDDPVPFEGFDEATDADFRSDETAGETPVAKSMEAEAKTKPKKGAVVDKKTDIEESLAKLEAPAPFQEELGEKFAELLDNWEDEEAHSELVKRAAITDDLAFVGVRYRVVREILPDDDYARKAQDQIVAMAMVRLKDAEGTPEEKKKKPRFMRGQKDE